VLTSPLRSVNLNHFRLLRVVGKGAFGKVRIVERKDTGLTFALKYIRKDESQLS
jgi:serine/threonine kinase 32